MSADAFASVPEYPTHRPPHGQTLRRTLADPIELLDAWRRVKRAGGQPGPDGVTVEHFESQLHDNIQRLASSIKHAAYQSGRLGRHYLKKKDGGFRVIGIPNVVDRVVHAAAAEWLHARIEPLLSRSTFAYRPRLGPQRAAVFAAKLAEGHAWVIAADVAKYFDNVNHDTLLSLLADLEVDCQDRALIQQWLRATPTDRGNAFVVVKGLPQGLAIAPPLANLYLHHFDTELEARGWAHVRFADDFVVFAPTEGDAGVRLGWMAEYLRTQRQLTFKPSKTSIIPVARGFDFVGFRVDRECLRLPNDAPDRFKSSIEDRLARLSDDVDGTVRTVNDLTRGWRAYYGGVSPVLTRQLHVLEAWRRVRIALALSRAGLPQLWLAKMFETLLEGHGEPPLGAYGPSVAESATEVATQMPTPAPARRVTSAARPDTPVRRPAPREPPMPAKSLRTLAVGIALRPWLTDAGDLIVPTHGAFVTRAGQTIVVRRRQETVLELPLDAIKHVTMTGIGSSLSGSALAALVRRGARIWVTDRLGRGLGSFSPAKVPLAASLGRRQLRAAQTRTGAQLAKELLEGKLKNQRALLLYHSKRASRADELRNALKAAASGVRSGLADLRSVDGPLRTSRSSLFLVEARAAAIYWSAFGRMVPSELGFPGRRGRGASDAVNVMLNYGYHKLLHMVWQAVDRSGLVPWFGVLHTGRKRSPALVLDLMESFRAPAVDRVVLGLMGRGFQPRQHDDGRLRLPTRVVFEKAWAANASRPLGSTATLERAVREHVFAFRRALESGGGFKAQVMPW